MMPPEYELDYLVFSASHSITEEEEVWNLPLVQLVKRLRFKGFNSYVEKTLLKMKKNG